MSDGGQESERKATFIEQARRRQIVEAAIEVLAESGYGGTTFVRIAERAGISPALISYHFAGKQRLMDQIVTDITTAMDEAVVVEIESATSYREVLRALIETQVRYFADHTTEVLALGHIFRSGDDEIADRLAADRTRTLGEMEDLFEEGQEAGVFGPFPTRPMAVTLLAALEAVPGELFARPGLDVDQYGRAVADIFDVATTAPPPGR